MLSFNEIQSELKLGNKHQAVNKQIAFILGNHISNNNTSNRVSLSDSLPGNIITSITA